MEATSFSLGFCLIPPQAPKSIALSFAPCLPEYTRICCDEDDAKQTKKGQE